MDDQQSEVAALLARAGDGDRDALDAALPLVYAELRRLATLQFRGDVAIHTLSPTGLVHEAWMRIADRARWHDQSHFFALAAKAMRQVLVDHARRHHALRRGGGVMRLGLDDIGSLAVEDRAALVIALDEALDRLATFDARQARVIECRFFGGLTEEETAEVIGASVRTIKRDWAKARAWLWAELGPDAP